MIYEVNESRFFDILGIKEIDSQNAKLSKIQEDKGIAYFNLELELNYININKEIKKELITFPIEFNVRESEEIDVNLKNISINVTEDKGIDLIFDISVDVNDKEEIVEIIEEIEEDVLSKVEQIKEIIMNDEKEDEILELNIINNLENKVFNLADILKNSYQKYKMIILDDESIFDKISLKYNIKMEELFRMKKEGLKVIVCAKE